MSASTIPVLDLRQFEPGSETSFVKSLGSALEEFGFFAVSHHGVESELICRAYRDTEAFFTLPAAVKQRYEHLELKGQRGFTSFGREHAKDHPAPDLKEFWHVGRELPPDHADEFDYPGNIWPEEVPCFRKDFSELYRQLDACALRLLDAVALYLGEPRERIREMAREGNSILRIIHYPPVEQDVHPASVRAAPHEDINLITLLCEATAPGLEIQNRAGHWLSVQPPPGQIVVDGGDMLENLTNGLLRSATHRVVNPEESRERRFSMPFFVHPRSDVSLSPLERCIQRTGGVKRFQDITAGDYLQQRLREIGLAGD